jgi:hypothetical protein
VFTARYGLGLYMQFKLISVFKQFKMSPCCYEVEDKVIPKHCVKAYGGSGGTAPLNRCEYAYKQCLYTLYSKK